MTVTEENAVIDPIDRDILSALERDGRMSFRNLAEAVGLSANAVAERVRKLEERRVIRRFRADVDPIAFGLTLRALIEVKMESHTTAEQFEAREQQRPASCARSSRPDGMTGCSSASLGTSKISDALSRCCAPVG